MTNATHTILTAEYVLGLVAKYDAEIKAAQHRFDMAESDKGKQKAWDDKSAATRTWNKWNAKAWEMGAYDMTIDEILWSDGGVTIAADGTFTGAGALQGDLTLDSNGNLHTPDGYEFAHDNVRGWWSLPAQPGTYHIAHCPDDETISALVRAV